MCLVCFFLAAATAGAPAEDMRAEVLVVWLGLTLCCALPRTGEAAEETGLSERRLRVGESRGPLAGRRGQQEEGDVEMADEPAEATKAEKPKPKKKKTPEEIEAGKSELPGPRSD